MIRTLLALCLCSLCLPALTATLVHNIQGYTMDGDKLLSFRGLEFEDGKITRLHTDKAGVAASKAADRIDGGGATLLPGLIDAHGHIFYHGELRSTVNMAGIPSEDAAVQMVADFIAENPDREWITGRGWNQVLWPGKRYPHRTALDAVTADKPAIFRRIDGHAVWANSEALRLAGIDENTPNPAGGEILKDADGKPNGILIDNAMFLVLDSVPPYSDKVVRQMEDLALRDLASLGLTSVHDAGARSWEIRALQAMREEDAMPIRVYCMLSMLDPANEAYLKQGPLLDPQELLVIRSIKIYADGALGSRGAALFEDYSDDPGNRGLIRTNNEQMEIQANKGMTAGYQVNIHAIGDDANARVLDHLERLIKQHNSGELRHRDEHSQVIRLQDIPRFAEIGVIASIQPTHATSDKNMAGDRLGEERLKGAYAWRKLLDAGAQLAGGSDFPVEPANPFFGLHAAVTRQSRDNEPPGGWRPEDKLTREEALSLFTQDAAYAAHQEKVIGRLLPGYFADFILVRDDYFQVPEQDIWKNEVLGTWVAGRKVYSKE